MDSRDSRPIIFFDGVCGLCNAFVDFVLARDAKAIFRFAPLQGQAAGTMLGDWADPLQSVILMENGRAWEKSDAVLRILPRLGGAWRLAPLFRAAPRCLRDFAYDFIAKRRYAWFGKRNACRVPSPEEQARFLS